MWNNKHEEKSSSTETTNALYVSLSLKHKHLTSSQKKRCTSWKKVMPGKDKKFCILQRDDARKEQEHDLNEKQQ